MTEHNKIMLVRHLRASQRHYMAVASQLRSDGHEVLATVYDEYARDADLMALILTGTANAPDQASA